MNKYLFYGDIYIFCYFVYENDIVHHWFVFISIDLYDSIYIKQNMFGTSNDFSSAHQTNVPHLKADDGN